MTPLQIEMLFSINVGKTPEGLENNSQREAIQMFLREDLVIRRVYGDSPYALSARGEAYVQFLIQMPLPVANWQIPGHWDPTTPTGDKA